MNKIKSIINKIIIQEMRNLKESVEYVIWGIPPGKTDEDLLVSKLEGKPVTDLKVAEKVKDVLETKHGCKKVRIQTLDMADGDFSTFKKPF